MADGGGGCSIPVEVLLGSTVGMTGEVGCGGRGGGSGISAGVNGGHSGGWLGMIVVGRVVWPDFSGHPLVS